MNGILLINKPTGCTSHDVVNKVRRILKTKKVGHVGTLDPLATGVLVILVNEATKIADFLVLDDKEYSCEVRIGIKTDSYDIDGNIIEEVKDYNLEIAELDKALNTFLGKSMQVPPIYSAVKLNGKKLYEYARNNQDVLIDARPIEVYSITRESDIIDDLFNIKLHVSKGTYIRSIVNDLGEKLKIPMTINNLKRVKSGKFKLCDCYSLEEVEIGNYHLINMTDALDIEKINIGDNLELYKKIKNGMKLSLKAFNKKYLKIAFVKDDRLLAIYEYFNDVYQGYKAIRIFNE